MKTAKAEFSSAKVYGELAGTVAPGSAEVRGVVLRGERARVMTGLELTERETTQAIGQQHTSPY